MELQSYIDLGLQKVGAVLDGKDFLCETVRSNRTVSISQQSNKMHADTFRILTYTLPFGLSFEHTDVFLSRVSEKGLVKL